MLAELQTDALPRGYTVRDVARRYRVSPDKVRAWVRRGELRAINTSPVLCGKPRWVITPEALERFEAARQAPAPPKSAPRRKRTTGTDYFPD
jgi:transposase-like protein